VTYARGRRTLGLLILYIYLLNIKENVRKLNIYQDTYWSILTIDVKLLQVVIYQCAMGIDGSFVHERKKNTS